MGFNRKIFQAFVAVLAAAQVVVSSASGAQVEALRSAARKLEGRALSTDDERRKLIEPHRAKVEELIRDLEAGREIDPTAIDRILDEAERICR